MFLVFLSIIQSWSFILFVNILCVFYLVEKGRNKTKNINFFLIQTKTLLETIPHFPPFSFSFCLVFASLTISSSLSYLLHPPIVSIITITLYCFSTLCEHILAIRSNTFLGKNFVSHSSLKNNFKLLSTNRFLLHQNAQNGRYLQSLKNPATLRLDGVGITNKRQGVNTLAIDQYINLSHGFPLDGNVPWRLSLLHSQSARTR